MGTNLASIFHSRFSFPAVSVCSAVRIAVLVCKIWQHSVKHAWVYRSGCLLSCYQRMRWRIADESTNLHVEVNWPSLILQAVFSPRDLQLEAKHILFESQTHAKPERPLATTYLASV